MMRKKKIGQKRHSRKQFLVTWLWAENGTEEKIGKKLGHEAHATIFCVNMRGK